MKKSKLTTIIIVTINGKVLIDVISKLSKRYRIIIVENNKDYKFKNSIIKKNRNIEVLVPKKNIGFASGNNLALKMVKTPYVLLLNPDVVLNENNIRQFEYTAKKNKNFSIFAPNCNGFNQIMETNLDKLSNVSFSKKKLNNITEIPWVPGWCMFCNYKLIRKVNFFDKNFFLYFEEVDLCKRLQKLGHKFYLIKKNKIIHNYHGTSKNLSKENELKHWQLRLWHYYWSSFYFHRKHYGFVNSFFSHISKLIRFTIKKYASLIKNDDKSYILSKAKANGLIAQIFNKKSFFRVKL